LIAFVFLVQRIFRGRMSASWRHALWLLVVARLALPASLESRVSVFNWLHLGAPTLRSQKPSPTVTVALTAPVMEVVSPKDKTTAAFSPANGKLILGESDPAASTRPDGSAARNKIVFWL